MVDELDDVADADDVCVRVSELVAVEVAVAVWLRVAELDDVEVEEDVCVCDDVLV